MALGNPLISSIFYTGSIQDYFSVMSLNCVLNPTKLGPVHGGQAIRFCPFH